MTSQSNQIPSFAEFQRINKKWKENRMNHLLSKLGESPAADTQYNIYPEKLYSTIPTEVTVKKKRNIQEKDFPLEPATGCRSDQTTNNQQLQIVPKVVNPLQQRAFSGLSGMPLDLATSIYGRTQPMTPGFQNLQQLYNYNEKQKLLSLAVEGKHSQRKLNTDILSSQGIIPYPWYMCQPPFSMSTLKFPPNAMNSPVLNLPQMPISKTEAPPIPTAGFYDPNQVADFSRHVGYKPAPNTFWPVPPNSEQLSGFRFVDNAWWPVRKSVRPLPKRPNFFCRDCKTTFEATILKKSNKGAVQHRCSFVGRPITRRVGIRSKVCKGQHPGACIIPLGELTEDDKAVDGTREEELEPVFCSNMGDLTYVKRYAQTLPFCRIRVWRLSGSTNWGTKSVEYYDCQCNQLFPPVANIEVAKKHACQHDKTKNCCDICGKWFNHHLQVNAHKKIHKAHLKKIHKRERSVSETQPQVLDPRGTIGIKKQKRHHEEPVPKTEATSTTAQSVTWPPAMFYNPQFWLNNRLTLQRQAQGIPCRPDIIPNPVIPGSVLPGLRYPNLGNPGSVRPTPSRPF